MFTIVIPTIDKTHHSSVVDVYAELLTLDIQNEQLIAQFKEEYPDEKRILHALYEIAVDLSDTLEGEEGYCLYDRAQDHLRTVRQLCTYVNPATQLPYIQFKEEGTKTIRCAHCAYTGAIWFVDDQPDTVAVFQVRRKQPLLHRQEKQPRPAKKAEQLTYQCPACQASMTV